ncbi:hypothetical protein F4604DRAFT_642162 [Suillus subluteus]|nr:hypothetical protein F4604DRAFT_642162 [Suillus subluteus]
MEATTVMKESPRYARLQTIDQTVPSKKFASKIEDLPRKHGTLVFQLRTGHVALNKHLHRIARTPTATCPGCQTHEETLPVNVPQIRQTTRHARHGSGTAAAQRQVPAKRRQRNQSDTQVHRTHQETGTDIRRCHPARGEATVR